MEATKKENATLHKECEEQMTAAATLRLQMQELQSKLVIQVRNYWVLLCQTLHSYI